MKANTYFQLNPMSEEEVVKLSHSTRREWYMNGGIMAWLLTDMTK